MVKNGENKKPCFIPDFNRNILTHTPQFIVIPTMRSLYKVFNVAHFFNFEFILDFYPNSMLDFVKGLFCIY